MANKHYTYTNADGVLIRRGPKQSVTGLTRESPERGLVRKLVVDFEFDNLPGVDEDTTGDGTPNAFSGQVAPIPRDHTILSATLFVGEEWTTVDVGTLQIGIAQKNGTPIDADGIIEAKGNANLKAGMTVAGDGDVIGLNRTVDSYIYASWAANNFTGGSARLVIEFTRSA